MIIYTLVPQEYLYQEEEQGQNRPQAIELNGVQMLVQPSGGQMCEIVRLLSSNPYHYLDSQYAPGQKITISYQMK